jgi:hypothetical protein
MPKLVLISVSYMRVRWLALEFDAVGLGAVRDVFDCPFETHNVAVGVTHCLNVRQYPRRPQLFERSLQRNGQGGRGFNSAKNSLTGLLWVNILTVLAASFQLLRQFERLIRQNPQLPAVLLAGGSTFRH